MEEKLLKKLDESAPEILIIDESEESLLAIEFALNTQENTLVKCPSIDTATRTLLGREPALILINIQLAVRDKFNFVSNIRENRRTKNIPILFTGPLYTEENLVQMAYEFGAVDYVQTPCRPDILRAKTRNLLALFRNSNRLLRSEQNNHRRLSELIDQGFVWAADAVTLAPTFLSESYETILGYSTYASLSHPDFIFSHVHPDDRDTFSAGLRALIQTEKNIGFDHRFIRSNGDPVWCHTQMQLLENEKLGSNEIRGFSTDISAQRQAEEMGRRARLHSDLLAEWGRFQSESIEPKDLFSKLSENVVPKYADLIFIEMYSEDYTTREIETGKTVQFAETDYQALRSFLDERKFLHSEKAELHTKDPHDLLDMRAIESIMIAPLLIRGRCRGTISLGLATGKEHYTQADFPMLEDLARGIAMTYDNAHLFALAREAVRGRDEFLSIASHELKTPLTPLKLQTQSLMRMLSNDSLSSLSPDRLKKMLETSDRQIERLARLIDDLLDISRISAGKLEITLSKFDLIELIHSVIGRFSEQISSSGSSLELSTPSSLTVTLDPFRIEQVLANLLTNAIKYGEGKKIELRCRRVGDDVEISFRDYGIGIAPADRDRVFQRFERAVSSNHFGGLGLGLYIVNQILESHHGRVTLDSELGQGSTFTLTLPIYPVLMDLSADAHYSLELPKLG